MTSNNSNVDVKIKIEIEPEINLCSEPKTDPEEKDANETKINYDFSVNMPEDYKGTYDAFVNKILTMSSIPILKSLPVESIINFKYYNSRYYEDKYCIQFGVTETGYHDINVRIHSNKLLLIALASGNDIVRNQKDISEINFVVNNVDRSNIKLSGKKKMGSKSIEPHTILCQVKYQGDEKLYNIRAGVNGRIIEINELIKANPNFIKTDPKGLGFIAVIAPQGKPTEFEKKINKLNLLSEEEYSKHLLTRVPCP